MSDDKVVNFTGVTRLDLDPCHVLGNVPDTLQSVVIVGYDEDGSLYFSSNKADGAEIVWLLECAKHELMRAACGGMED